MRSLTTLILLTTAAIASGCSSKNEPASGAGAAAVPGGWQAVTAVSGTRLHARLIDGGGSRELVGFHDSERNEDCTFQPAEEGRSRCLPTTVPTVQAGGFSDPACKIPLASAPGCGGETIKYAISYRYDGGDCNQAVAEIRAVTPVSKRYAPGPNGACTLQPSSSSAPGPFVALGDVIPWTAFVPGIETITPGDPVAEKILVTPDGARQHLGYRIESLGVDCTFQLMEDGYTRCVPEAGVGQVFYTDYQCTKASFVNDYQTTGPCGKTTGNSKLWLEPSTNGCAATHAVYSLRDAYGGDVAPYESFDLYTHSSTGTGTPTSTEACTSLGSGGPYNSGSRRAIDADVTTSLPTTPRIRGGGGRLVPALVSKPASAELAVGWHDNERDADCTFTLASDNKLRCLPTGAEASVFHTDTACKSPSVVAVLGKVSCAGAARFARVVSKTCPPTTRVYALGTGRRDLTSASVETSPGHCPILQGVTNALDATEVDPTGFVEGLAAD